MAASPFKDRGDHIAWTRRELLLGGVSLAALAVVPPRARAEGAACVLTPELTEGPFYIDAARLRRNITEGRPGVPLHLRIVLQAAASCRPLPNAAVDLWHCDALGVYSGYARLSRTAFAGAGEGPPPPAASGSPPPKPQPEDRQSFLRGLQLTDADGVAQFDTIFPGWYAGRAVHIHLKVHVGGQPGTASYRSGHVCHTGQIAFPEDACAAVAQLPPYARHGVKRLPLEQDGVFDGSAAISTLRLVPLAADPAAGYLGDIVFSVDPRARPATF